MKQEQARQGDIFFEIVPEDKLPQNRKAYHSSILAQGEVTGHSHKVISPSMDQIEMFIDEKGDIFVKSDTEDIVVDHDEHGQVTLEKGLTWNVSRQREYDPLAEQRERRVAD